jgi:O-antigen/teichoic acid export membrane protein
MAVSGVVAAIFQARNSLVYINLSRFGFELGKALALVLSALILESFVLIGAALVLVSVVRASVDHQLLSRKVGITLSLKPVAEVIKYYKFVRVGLASFSTVVLTLLVTISDKIFIKELFSDSEVAYYSFAFDINSKAYLLVNAVNTAMFAVILKKFIKRSSTTVPVVIGLGAVAVVICVYYIPMFFFSEQIISLLVSSQFAEESAYLASVMSVASALYLLGNVFENATTAMGDAKSIMRVYVVAVVLYFCSLPALATGYGVVGFMYAYLLLCAILCVGFMCAYANRINQLNILGLPSQ